MGKKLDALLGRGFKTSKFKATVALAVSRLAVLKNQRQARCSVARSDVVEFLKNGNHDRALLRVEQVIKEQNMLDVFVLLEGYCHLLLERVNLIQHEKVCPEELNEAVSTLIHASTRCGEFPELQQIRAIFISRFGREFAARAVELRNNCGVNPKVVQKLSTKMPSLENKMKVLKEIASDNNLELPIEETENQDSNEKQKPGPSGVYNRGENEPMQPDEIERGDEFSDSLKARRKYRDVADAAQAAFESAAYAAAAARAAVELSRSESTDPDDPASPDIRPRKVSAVIQPMKSTLGTHGKDAVEDEDMKIDLNYEKIHLVQNYDVETKDMSSRVKKGVEQFKPNEGENVFTRSLSVSSSDSSDEDVKGVRIPPDEDRQSKLRDVVFDESDGEDVSVERSNTAQVGWKMERGPGNYPAQLAEEKRTQSVEPLNINRRPISVRTGWARVR